MNPENNEPRESLAPGVRESNAVVALPIGPHASDSAREGLFPIDPSLPVARPVPVQTSGRTEFAARCPDCGDWHRHVSLGEKDAPCGAHYRLEFANKGAA